MSDDPRQPETQPACVPLPMFPCNEAGERYFCGKCANMLALLLVIAVLGYLLWRRRAKP